MSTATEINTTPAGLAPVTPLRPDCDRDRTDVAAVRTELEGLTVAPLSLEDVYLKLTGESQAGASETDALAGEADALAGEADNTEPRPRGADARPRGADNTEDNE